MFDKKANAQPEAEQQQDCRRICQAEWSGIQKFDHGATVAC
ncbi:MAG: hypothetical protein WA822_03030 [Albidovulum sp.]